MPILALRIYRNCSRLWGRLQARIVSERHTTTPKNYSYFKVSEGCDRPVPFVPFHLWGNTAHPIEELVNRAEKLGRKGKNYC